MLRLAIAAISVGLADSINPSTIGPGLYLATLPKPVRQLTQFVIGVFSVNLVVGLVLTIGPGRALLGLVPRPQATARHVIELVAGVLLVVSAVALWLRRRSLAGGELPMGGGKGGSALIAGASIAVVELPTALPYFAVIAAIVASSASVPVEVGLVALYNVAFVLPLVAIIVGLLAFGERADRWLQRAGDWLQRQWPAVLATLLLLVGSGLIVIGATHLVRQ